MNNYATLKVKWKKLEGKVDELLTAVSSYHKKVRNADNLMVTASKFSGDLEGIVQPIKQHAETLLDYDWKAYSKICGSNRNKRSKIDQLNELRENIKRVRTDYSAELERIERSSRRVAASCTSTLASVVTETDADGKERPVISSKALRSFEWLTSPWVIHTQK